MSVYGPALRKCLRRADRIVVASPRHIEFSKWLQPFRDKCVVIPFGIDVARFNVEGKWPANAGGGKRPILLTVGRLVGYKGHRYLIEAMKNIDGTLGIVGTGPLEASLRQQAGPNVFFLGNVPDAELPALYQACDIFVLPSISPNEAFGVVQLEAMACGKPVISCDLPSGVPWVNQNEVTGLVVPPRDSDALSGAIKSLLANPEEARRMGAAGRARALAEFTEDRMIDRYYQLFTELAA
jgi:glycosyltransferase involved in cell wall biosynthesis